MFITLKCGWWCLILPCCRLSCASPQQKAFLILEALLREDDEVVQVWYLMGWLHHLTEDTDSSHFYLEQAKEVGCLCV